MAAFALLRRLKALHELHERARRFPVWPFDDASLRKFTASFFAPLLVGLLVEVLKNFLFE